MEKIKQAPQEMQEWEFVEFVDDAIAVGRLDAFVYEFSARGKKVQGLTARAIEHLALAAGISIESCEFVDEGDRLRCEVRAVRMLEPHSDASVSQPPRELQAFGVSSEKKADMYAHQKALTKACRNARRQLISAVDQLRAVSELLALQGAPPPASGSSEQMSPEQQAQTACFEQYETVQADLEALGIPKPVFWAGVKSHFGVADRSQMTVKQWRACHQALRVSGFAEWIRGLAVEPPVEPPVESPAEVSESSVEDMEESVDVLVDDDDGVPNPF